MPREPRIYIEKVLYFVTARVSIDKILFRDEQDYVDYLKLLSEYKNEYGFKLHAFALMPKQLRLLIELQNNVTISTIMHDLNSRYTKSYNGRYNKKGHLFQGRFKTVLVEKDQYLLRLTRYIHLLPKQEDAAMDCKDYSYSSYHDYLSTPKNRISALETPVMQEEIEETLAHLGETDAYEDLKGAYEAYVDSADDKEMMLVSKLLHRTAFVGSKDFAKEIKNRVKDHIVEEEKARVVRKTNPVFIMTGSLVILFLGVVSYNLYDNQSTLQEVLNTTGSGFEAAREDLAERVYTLRNELTRLADKKYHGLNGLMWEVRITPLNGSGSTESYVDFLKFENGRVISKGFKARGFSSFDYSVTPKSHGRVAWETSQAEVNGMGVSWRGVYTGKKIGGILNERLPQGENRRSSFTSTRRLNNG